MDIMAFIKGDIGEALTAHALRNELGLITVRNMYLPVKNDITEVDIIGLDRRGIFIIENKNYSGYVTPVLDGENWYVTYSQYMVELYSPVLQNRKHVEAVIELLTREGLDYAIPYINPVVIFNEGVLRKRCYAGDEKILGRDNFIENFDFLYPVANNICLSDIKLLQEILQKYKLFYEI